MKQHLGSTKQKAITHAQFAHVGSQDAGAVAALTNITQKLAQQLADVQQQLARLTAPLPTNSLHQTQSFSQRSGKLDKAAAQPNCRTSSQPRPGYCFRCGEDGHIRPQCQNEPNPTLVAKKKRQFAQKPQTTFRKNPLN